MLILKRHYQFWFSILALHKIGAICIPATNLLTTKDLVYRNNAASVKYIVCTADGDVSDYVNESQAESPSLKTKILVGGSKEGWYDFNGDIEKESIVFERPTGADETENLDICLMYFTSGTTGYPKMTAHDYTYPFGHIITAVYWHQAEPDGLHLTVAETGWAKSVWGKLYGQWFAETAIFVDDMDRFDPVDLLKKIAKYKVTTFCAPPTIYRFIIREDLNKYDFSSLRHLTTAGEALNPEIYNRMLQHTGIKIREGFGQTEDAIMVATFPWIEPKPGSMGKPSPGFDIDILNEKNESCYPGEVGEIVIRTDKGRPAGMFQGYYKDEELTEKAWHDNVYHTGDMVYKDEDGYIYYVSRTDDIIKSSGYRIGPFEVESALMEHPSVLECAITGVPDDLRGQIIKATVVLNTGYEPSDALKKELQNHVKNVTAPYKYPRIVEFVPELPKTISGKIKRGDIRKNS
jgi:acetyl-CoA synthetase